MFIRRFINYILLVRVVGVSSTSCGNGTPTGPLPGNWLLVSSVPADIKNVYGVIASSRVYPSVNYCYVAGENKNGKGVVYLYENNEWKISYEAPYANSIINDIQEGTGGDTETWAAGTVLENGSKKPLLLKEKYGANKWREIDIGPLKPPCITGIVPHVEACWLLLKDAPRDYGAPRAGVLGLYRYGSVTLFPELGEVTAFLGDAYPWDILFALEYAGDNPNPRQLGPGYRGTGKLFMTRNYGQEWKTEFIPRFIGSREVHAAVIAGYNDRVLYLTVKFKDGATGIVRRTGGYDAGVYKLLFVSYASPYFLNIRDIAFRHGTYPYGFSNDALGVGKLTTVVYDEGAWLVENTANPYDFQSLDGTVGPGFVACARDITFGRWELLYHP